MMKRLTLLILTLTVLCLALIGCGGSGSDDASSRGPGSLEITAVFEPASRDLPGYANRLRLTITLQGSSVPLDPIFIQRTGDAGGPATINLATVPSGRHLIVPEALSESGQVVAVAPPLNVFVVSGRVTRLRISSGLSSTIDRVAVDDAAALENPGLDVSDPPRQLGARALSSDGTVLLQNPGNGFVWSCDNPAVATITPGGIITAVGAGTANLTVSLRTPEGQKSSRTPLRVNGPVGAASFIVEWGAVNVNKAIPGYVKGITATLSRNGVNLATATFNRQNRLDAFDLTATFPGEFAAGDNYRIEITGTNRSNQTVGTATLTNVVVPFNSSNPSRVAVLTGGIDVVKMFRTDTGGGFGIGDELDEGATVTIRVGGTFRIRTEGQRAGIPALTHQDIAVTTGDAGVASVSDTRTEATITGVAPGTTVILVTADGGPSTFLNVVVNP
jgi:hypothetical protein